MNKSRINLLAEKNNKNENALFFLAFVIVIVSLYFNIISHVDLMDKKAICELEFAKIKPEYKQRISFNTLKDEVSCINNLLNIKNFSWSNFLSNLEKITPAGISISNVTPAFTTKEVRLEGMALSTNNLVNFMSNLQNSEFFSNVFIVEQKEVELKRAGPDITKLTGFILTFKYNEK